MPTFLTSSGVFTRSFLAALALTVLAAGCQGEGDGEGYEPRTPASSPTSTESRLIGLVGTLSGPDSWRGEDAFEGADVAIQVLNRRLGPDGGNPYELVSYDDGGEADTATGLVEEAAAQDRMVGIVYAGPPEGLPPAEDALADAGIPAVIAYGDLYGARRLTPHIFQASPSYRWEARRLAAYLVNDRGYRRVGALVEESQDGSAASRALEEGFNLAGAKAPVVVTYPPNPENLATPLRTLEHSEAEAIVAQGSPGLISTLLRDLGGIGATYVDTDMARTVTAPTRIKRRKHPRPWRPQIAAFDLGISPSIEPPPPPGTVASDSYARGAHYLPVPTLRGFRAEFTDWWDAQPTGWEQRSYDAVRALGWAADSAGEGRDLAVRLEALKGVRYGGLDITLGPDDHTFVGATTVGIWVSPRPSIRVRERPDLPGSLPWVPLARGFSIDGERTDILDKDWKYLFTKAPVRGAPAPRFDRMKFGVTTKARDPIH